MVLWFPQQLGIFLMHFNWMLIQSTASKLNHYESDAALMVFRVKFCIFWVISYRSFFFNLLPWGATATKTSAHHWRMEGSWRPLVTNPCRRSWHLQTLTRRQRRRKLRTWDQNIHQHKYMQDISVSCLLTWTSVLVLISSAEETRVGRHEEHQLSFVFLFYWKTVTGVGELGTSVASATAHTRQHPQHSHRLYSASIQHVHQYIECIVSSKAPGHTWVQKQHGNAAFQGECTDKRN